MLEAELLYEYHVPRRPYEKVWPESRVCPICNNTVIIRPGASRAFYIPKLKTLDYNGPRICIYSCAYCSIRYKNLSYTTLEEFQEHHKCHLEYEIHMRTLTKTGE